MLFIVGRVRWKKGFEDCPFNLILIINCRENNFKRDEVPWAMDYRNTRKGRARQSAFRPLGLFKAYAYLRLSRVFVDMVISAGGVDPCHAVVSAVAHSDAVEGQIGV